MVSEAKHIVDTKKNKKLKNLVLIMLLFIIVTLFSGCASTKQEAAMDTETNFTYTCQYDSVNNETNIKWATYFNNKSIFNISKIKIKFNFYFEDTLVYEEKEIIFDTTISYGKIEYKNYQFNIDGNIDKLSFCSWSAEFDNLWNSYKGWWIGSLIGIIVLIIVYLIYGFDFSDLSLDSVWIPLIIIILLPTIISFITSSWFILCIFLINFLLLCLTAAVVIGIIYLIERIINKSSSKSINIDKINSYTVEELKSYCSKNNIKGYSKLKKDEIIELIKNTLTIENCNNDKNIEVCNSSTKPQIENSNQPKSIKNSKITFEDIAGLDDAKEAFREKVIMPLQHPELYKKYSKKTGGGILLYGLPGTGKTMFAEAASNEVDALFIPIKCSDIKSMWYGESEQKVKKIFSKAKKANRAIIFFDEFEAIGSKRNDDPNNLNNDLVPEILAEMQGIGSKKNNTTIVVIAATNKPWSIDSAFLRPGRFDEKIYIPLPDEVARKKLLELKLNDVPQKDLDLDEFSKITEGFNGADIEEFCEKLKMKAIKENLKTNKEYFISMDDVLEISKIVKSSVSKQDIENLKKFEENN